MGTPSAGAGAPRGDDPSAESLADSPGRPLRGRGEADGAQRRRGISSRGTARWGWGVESRGGASSRGAHMGERVGSGSSHALHAESLQQRTVVVGDPQHTLRLAGAGPHNVLVAWALRCWRVLVGGSLGEGALPDNRISTGKYTLITFVPRNLFEQFHRVAYIYFLVLILVNQIPVLAVFGRFISLIPLLAVLVVTAIKDAYEDILRHLADHRENSRPCLVWAPGRARRHSRNWRKVGMHSDHADSPGQPARRASTELQPPAEAGVVGQFSRVKWASVRVGDIVQVHSNETVPCDMLILCSSDESGRVFVETMNLDGETSLKTRFAVPQGEALLRNVLSSEGQPRSQPPTPLSPGRSSVEALGSIDVQATSSSGPGVASALSLGGDCRSGSPGAATGGPFAGLRDLPSLGILVVEPPNRNIYEFTGYWDLPAPVVPPSLSPSPPPPGSSGTATVLQSSSEAPGVRSQPRPAPWWSSGQGADAAHLGADGASAALGPSNMLLRSCVVRNTGWVVGVAVYTGRQCKVVLNAAGAQSKRSRVESHMNRDMLLLSLLLFVLCLAGAIGMAVWLQLKGDVYALPYYGAQGNYMGVAGEAAVNFFSLVILLQVLVPISLYISVELMRLGQSYFMARDIQMQDPRWGGGQGLQCRALNINEDLGQVQHVLMDKTGTLTQNRMEFHSCAVSGIDVGALLLQRSRDLQAAQAQGQQSTPTVLLGAESTAVAGAADEGVEAGDRSQAPAVPSAVSPRSLAPHKVELNSATAQALSSVLAPSGPSRPGLPAEMAGPLAQHGAGQGLKDLEHFLLVLAACNTVVPTVVSEFKSGFLEMHPSSGGLESRKARQAAAAPAAVPDSAQALIDSGHTPGKAAAVVVDHRVQPSGPMSPSQNGAGAVQAEEAEAPSEETAHTSRLEFQGESPDEVALVRAAQSLGCTLVSRGAESVILDWDPAGSKQGADEREYQVLGVHEFTSQRKRMSVVLRCPDGTVLLLVKGADSVMFPLLEAGGGSGGAGREAASACDPWGASESNELLEPAGAGRCSAQQWQAQRTADLVDAYSRAGLRTLVMAVRELSAGQVADWAAEYQRASCGLGGDRNRAMDAVAEQVEQQLHVVGATGIEDRLQDGVPETLQLLAGAGIKLWMLTGDKSETAESIARSCGLLAPGMASVLLHAPDDPEECRAAMHAAAEELQRAPTLPANVAGSALLAGGTRGRLGWRRRPSVQHAQDMRDACLVVDGATLVHALSKDLQAELLDLCRRCRVVLCCRVAPIQKAAMVRLIKDHAADLTLAIGDGANDVSMIQTAGIGVGISGEEGRQAVMSSDFAISQFRFLGRLLLVHGHWNYHRIAYMVLYNLYKNAVFVLLLFWYTLFTAFSAISCIGQLSLVLYSMLYTSVPTVIVGILDQDVSQRTLMRWPALYGPGVREETYNARMFAVMMLDVLWQSIILFGAALLSVGFGEVLDFWSLGQVWLMALVLVVTFHLALDISLWAWPHHASIWFSVGATFITVLVIDYVIQFPEFGSFRHASTTAVYWLDLCLIVVVSLLPRFVVKYTIQQFRPSDIQIAKEYERTRALSHRQSLEQRRKSGL